MTDEAARSLLQVVPINDRVCRTDWMEFDRALRGFKGLYGRTVDFFPALFRSSDRRVNLNKARDWWKKREKTAVSLANPAQQKFATSRQRVRHQFVVKALGREGITMCVLLKGGSDARILCPMLIFKNKSSNYPILNLPDTTLGVCYRTSPSAFINGRLMAEWLRESRCWGTGGPFTNSRVLWMDNSSGHCGGEVEDAAREFRTKVKYFPPNATDKVQPADRFPIQRIKEHWRLKLANPGKKFFLELAAECIRLVNLEKNKNGDNWAKKSMIQCGLDVSRDGVWKVDQLSKELKQIIAFYPDAFEEGMTDEAARSLLQVVPINDRVCRTDWMEFDRALRGFKGLYGRTVDFFPALFRSSDRRVNLNKARDWWKKREKTAVSLANPAQQKFATSRQRVRHQFVVKALGREGITMCVLLKGGSDARILCPMLIFKNKSSNYPILNLPDTTLGVCYRTSPSAFINGRLMAEWLRESRCWGTGGPFTNSRVLWMDNSSGHCGGEVEDAAREFRTKVKYFPPNATDKVQPADRFPIQRIKEHWRLKLANPGKKFFLELAAECIRLVNLEKNKNGDNWAKKSMIQCGLDVSRDGVWKVDQLSKELKQIIAFYPDAFEEGYRQCAMFANL
ncbi:hypothetical protein PHMEG_00018170 [Phytophthora megakarya]|uniref:DDE-1 domain-containing protein n=1 Tax=Phytophthora megakarya TaxID=4795 RepID=A0A225VX83_9STRA|nr:hypothetical protein PHMEG_00018170 [Phytophthora megakarya]